MLNGHERIEELGRNMLEEAQQQAEKIISDAEKASERLIAEAKEKYRQDEETQVAQDKHETDVTYSKEISKKDYTVHKTVLSYRNEKVNEIFDKVYKKIDEFTTANEYVIYLKKLIEKANNEKNFYDDCIVYYSKKDEELINSIVQIKTMCDKNIRLGGISVFYPKENMFIDYSLDTAFENQRKEFVNHSELSL